MARLICYIELRQMVCFLSSVAKNKEVLFFMDVLDILVMAVGLSMDAFAVAICKGLSVRKLQVNHAVIVGLWFGCFQALMPLAGYYLGSTFADLITKYSHWIAFGLLVLIGINMIREAFSKDEEKVNDSFSVKAMLPMAVATSIDALAVGVSLSLVENNFNIYISVGIIGLVTFIFSCIGVKIGNAFGTKYKSSAEFTGGCILIVIGLKILLSGLGIIDI